MVSLKLEHLDTDEIIASLTLEIPFTLTECHMTIDDLVHLAAQLTASGMRSVALSAKAARRELSLDLNEDVLAVVVDRADDGLTVLLWRPDGRYSREALRLPADHSVADLLPR